MEKFEKIYHWETTGDLKTLGTMLQNIVEEDWKFYSLFEFLTGSTEEDRKKYMDKLVDADRKQFFEFMDWYTFVNETEVNTAVSEYFEKTMDRDLSMWEMWDISENAEYYMRERNLNFDEDFDAREDENAFLDSCEDWDFEDIDALAEKYMTFGF
jgi:hypothetical protein